MTTEKENRTESAKEYRERWHASCANMFKIATLCLAICVGVFFIHEKNIVYPIISLIGILSILMMVVAGMIAAITFMVTQPDVVKRTMAEEA